ncbi:MAG: FHA domain-containing protein [Deltaproteobacteria bacterium]|nr:FHA domain-containing protein [Deltaproteobacteria bacterium]
MRARLFCRYGKMKGASFEIGEEVTLGRGDSNTIVLPPKAISSHHAKILYDADRGGYVLEDLGSLNGTEVDGAVVSSPRRLDRLHLITFGGSLDFIFQSLDAFPNASSLESFKGSSAKEGTQAGVEPPDLPSILASQKPGASPAKGPEGGGTLIDRAGVVLPPNLGSLPEDVSVDSLGASPSSEAPLQPAHPQGTQADVDLPSLPLHLQGGGSGTPSSIPASAEASPSEVTNSEPTPPEPTPPEPTTPAKPSFWLELSSPVGPPRKLTLVEGDNVVGRGEGAEVILEGPDISRRHAVISLRGESLTLRDEGSSNHTYLGGQRLTGEVPLEVGVEIRFGSLEARLKSSLQRVDREDPS